MNYDVILPIAIAISTMLFVVKLQKPPKPMNFFRGWMYAISILLGMISIGLINNYQDLFLQNDILLLRWQDTLIFIVLFLITAWGVISGGLLIIDKHPWGWILVVLLILLRQTVIQWMKIGEVDYLPTLIALAGGAIVGLAWRRFWTIMDKN